MTTPDDAMANCDVEVLLTSLVLDIAAIQQRIEDVDCGAQLIFLGCTRRTTGDQVTTFLVYDAYQPMAENELRNLAQIASQRWPLRKNGDPSSDGKGGRGTGQRHCGCGESASSSGDGSSPVDHGSPKARGAHLEKRELCRWVAKLGPSETVICQKKTGRDFSIATRLRDLKQIYVSS